MVSAYKNEGSFERRACTEGITAACVHCLKTATNSSVFTGLAIQVPEGHCICEREQDFHHSPAPEFSIVRD